MRHVLRTTLAATAAFLGGCSAVFEPEPGPDPVAVFEHLWTTFDGEYAGFAARGVDWATLYDRYRPQVNASTTDRELFAVLSDLLAHLNDGHVTLAAPGLPVFLASRYDREGTGRDLFDVGVIRDRYLEPGWREGSGSSYLYGRIRGRNLGYIRLRGVDGTFTMLPRMLDTYPDAEGYIVDLRQNTGGNHVHAFAAMGRLTDTARFVFRSRTKNGPGPTDYTPWHDWHLVPAGTPVLRPMVVLTDRRTPSAAERAVMAFRTLPNVIVLGDTTNGSISTKIGRELANGWYYSLSPQQVEAFDGTSYEGRGLAPDIIVRNNRTALLAGVDHVLEAAIERLR